MYDLDMVGYLAFQFGVLFGAGLCAFGLLIFSRIEKIVSLWREKREIEWKMLNYKIDDDLI